MKYQINLPVPDIKTFHNQLKLAFPTFDGLDVVGDVVFAEFTSELTLNDQEILQLITPQQAPEVFPPLSQSQVRISLIQNGFNLIDIDNAINSMTEPDKTKALIQWEFTTIFERNHPFVIQVCSMLGLTDAQLDNLWRFAKTIN